MNLPRVLVVDDDEDLRKSVLLILENVCPVLQATTGEEAIEIVRKEKPRVMLLDYSLPKMDGTQVLEAALVIDPRLSVVMLTSQTELKIARRALALGATSFVTKPFDIDFLRSEVERLLGSKPPDDNSSTDRPWRVVT